MARLTCLRVLQGVSILIIRSCVYERIRHFSSCHVARTAQGGGAGWRQLGRAGSDLWGGGGATAQQPWGAAIRQHQAAVAVPRHAQLPVHGGEQERHRPLRAGLDVQPARWAREERCDPAGGGDGGADTSGEQPPGRPDLLSLFEVHMLPLF